MVEITKTNSNNEKNYMKKTQLLSKLLTSNNNSIAYNLSYYNVYTHKTLKLYRQHFTGQLEVKVYTTFVDYILVRCAKQFHE